jgi:hypothetical protein
MNKFHAVDEELMAMKLKCTCRCWRLPKSSPHATRSAAISRTNTRSNASVASAPRCGRPLQRRDRADHDRWVGAGTGVSTGDDIEGRGPRRDHCERRLIKPVFEQDNQRRQCQ